MINFYKLCMFGRNTIDEHNLKTIFMLFQAVSKLKIFNFYVMKQTLHCDKDC